MKLGKFFNCISVACLTLMCGTLASVIGAVPAYATSNPGSMTSLETMGRAQNFAFMQSLATHQNSLHSFSHDLGKSTPFFGEEAKADGNGANKMMDVLAKYLGVNDEGGGALPQFWSNKVERFGKVDDGADSFKYHMKGFTGGLDVRTSNSWAFGVSAGYTKTSGEFASLYDTSTHVNAYHTAVYSTFEREKFTLDNSLSFTYLRNNSTRGVDELASQVAEGGSSGYAVSWTLSAMSHETVENIILTPLAGFTYSAQMIHGLNESGAGAANLSTIDHTTHSLRPMLGIDVARAFDLGEGRSITPEVYGIYRYEMMDNTARIDAHSQSFDQPTLNTASTALSRHSLQIGGGVGVNLGQGLTGKLSYDSDMQPGSHEHRGMFRLVASW